MGVSGGSGYLAGMRGGHIITSPAFPAGDLSYMHAIPAIGDIFVVRAYQMAMDIVMLVRVRNSH